MFVLFTVAIFVTHYLERPKKLRLRCRPAVCSLCIRLCVVCDHCHSPASEWTSWPVCMES